MNLELEEGKRVSNRVIEMENVAKRYDYLSFNT